MIRSEVEPSAQVAFLHLVKLHLAELHLAHLYLTLELVATCTFPSNLYTLC